MKRWYSYSHVLYGALVGGPSETDQYADALTNREQCSVSLDYNAGFQSALAAVLDLHIFGMEDRPNLDKPGEITAESGRVCSRSYFLQCITCISHSFHL